MESKISSTYLNSLKANLHAAEGSLPEPDGDAAARGTGERLPSFVSKPSTEAEEQRSNTRRPSLNGRPPWAPNWAPTWAVTLSPAAQAAVVAAGYALHLGVLCRTTLPLPCQLWPNDHALFQSINMDSVAGALALVLFALARGADGSHPFQPRPTPWRWQKQNRAVEEKGGKIEKEDGDATLGGNGAGERERDATSGEGQGGQLQQGPSRDGGPPRWVLVTATAILVQAYAASAYAGVAVDRTLEALVARGAPISIPMQRALQVLLSHLSWVFLGSGILSAIFHDFFSEGREGRPRWMRLRWRRRDGAQWAWWALGGYLVSAFLFNVCDLANQYMLPSKFFEQETVVSQMIQPEGNDVLSMVVGALAPCVTAPWWEEVLYRGYVLPCVGRLLGLPLPLSVPLSAVLFSLHHLNVAGALPLLLLGWIWAILYIQSQNLLVTIIIHAMWNSRVFLGSYLGV